MTDQIRIAERRPPLLGGLLALALLLAACEDGEVLGGGSSDQGNAVAVVLQDAKGHPIPFAQVRVRPGTWTLGTALTTGTFADRRSDSLGRVLIPGLFAGAYVVEALQDSLVGSTGRIQVKDTVSARILMEIGSSLILRSSDSSATGFALRGLQRVAMPSTGGRFEFHQVPRADLEIETKYPGKIVLNTLPSLQPGTRAEVTMLGDTLRMDSGSLAGISIAAPSGNLFTPTTLDLVPAGLAAVAQRRLDDGTWGATSLSMPLDSTTGGLFRLTNGSWSSPPQRIRWNLWSGRPRELFGFAADGTDTSGFPEPAFTGVSRLADGTGAFLRMDTTQSIDWGLALTDSIPEGAVEILFRPGPGFQRDRAYSLLSNNGGRLVIGYLRGLLYFTKGTDYTHRWITSPPGQLLEARWYTILATWGPQGMTLSVDGELVGWSTDISGYSPGMSTSAQLGLHSGAKDSCCLEALGIVSPQKLDGDIASVHMYVKQPILRVNQVPQVCPDSVAGDLRARCGTTTTPRGFEVLY